MSGVGRVNILELLCLKVSKDDKIQEIMLEIHYVEN